MLKYGNKEYRNLQEQVYKNTTDIAAIVPGTSAYGVVFEYVVETATELPEATKENTFAFVKDENAIYVSEKHDDVIEWVDTGVKIGTGPQGPQGETGPTGPKGDKGDSGVYVGADEPPADYDVWIDLQGNPVEYQPKLTAGQNITIIDNVISATGGGGGGTDFTIIPIERGSQKSLSYDYADLFINSPEKIILKAGNNYFTLSDKTDFSTGITFAYNHIEVPTTLSGDIHTTLVILSVYYASQTIQYSTYGSTHYYTTANSWREPTETLTNLTVGSKTYSIPQGGEGHEYAAGNGINIANDTISVNTNVVATNDSVDEKLAGKQDELVAGQNITITDGHVISATGGSGEPIEYIKRTTISPDGKSLTIVKNNDTSTVFSPAFQAEHDVFVCRKGVTPFSEILTAYMADKAIVMIDPDGNDSSFYQLSRAVAGGGSVAEFQFTKVEGFSSGTGKFKLKNYSLYSNNFWQYSEKVIDATQETTYYGGQGISITTDPTNPNAKTISTDEWVARRDGNVLFEGGQKTFEWSGTNPPLVVKSDTRDDSVNIACNRIKFADIDANGSWSYYDANGYYREWTDEGRSAQFQFPHTVNSYYNTIVAAPMPANDGTYTLRLVMDNGLPTFTWISNT